MNKVGIDVSQEKVDAAVRVKATLHHKVFPNTNSGRCLFLKSLRSLGIIELELYMEATGRYWEALANWGYQLGFLVYVINPRLIRKFAEAKQGYNKTDKLDAIAILRFGESCQSGDDRAWGPKSDAQLELRDLQMEISALEKMIAADRSRLKCGLHSEAVAAVIKQNIENLKQLQKRLRARAKSV